MFEGEPWNSIDWAPNEIGDALVLIKNPWRIADVPSIWELPFLCESDLNPDQNPSRVEQRLELQGSTNFGLPPNFGPPLGNFGSPGRDGQQFDSNFINQLYNEHNKYRKQNGRPSLQPDRNIENILRRLRSITTSVGHNHNQIPNLRNYSFQQKGCRRTAENLAWNFGLNARDILNQWKNSPGHNRNILTNRVRSC